MNRPVGQTRIEMVKRGIDVSPLDTRWGVRELEVWKKKLSREKAEKVKKAQFEQYKAYIMSGISPGVELEDRQKAMKPVFHEYKDAVFRDLFTIQNTIQRYKKKRNRALKQKRRFERINKLTSGEYSVQDWIEGKI